MDHSKYSVPVSPQMQRLTKVSEISNIQATVPQYFIFLTAHFYSTAVFGAASSRLQLQETHSVVSIITCSPSKETVSLLAI